MGNNISFLDLLTILSFIIGIQNLELNIEQSQQIDQHLSQQDEEMLSKIIAQNEELLALLKEKK